MKRKILLCVLAGFMVFAAVSCDSNDLEQTYTTVTHPKGSAPAGDVTTSITTTAVKPVAVVKVDNETPYDELITKPIDIHDVIQKYFATDELANPLFTEIAADIGVECLRKTDTYYSVHKVKQGGLFYLFYSDEEDPQKRKVIRWFYEPKRLCKADFAGIKDGESTIDDVKKIDPAVQIFENLSQTSVYYQEYPEEMGSWHLLEDGILEIEYKKQNDVFKVNMQVFWDDFILRLTTEASAPVHYAQLLPDDFPPKES